MKINKEKADCASLKTKMGQIECHSVIQTLECSEENTSHYVLFLFTFHWFVY